MANYFAHVSCLLDLGTSENAARALDPHNTLSADGASEKPPSEDFLLSIQPEHGGSRLWMRDDVTGDPWRPIQFVKRCAAEFGLPADGPFHTPTPAHDRVLTAPATGPLPSTSPPARP